VYNFKYDVLCYYGEDEYARGIREEMAKAMLELPWNQGRSMEDMLRIIAEEGYDVERLVQDQIDAFWEGDKIYG
jgi:hypothetical protein